MPEKNLHEYLKEAEELLQSYNDINRSIRFAYRKRQRLIWYHVPAGYPSMDFQNTPVTGGGKHHDTINQIQEIYDLTKSIVNGWKELKEIDGALRDVSQDPGCELYGQVLRGWYIDGKNKQDLAKLYNCSTRHVYRVRNDALLKFAVNVFGLDVLKAKSVKIMS